MGKYLQQLLVMVLACLALPAQAVILYGVQQGNANLITVDTLTGVITNVGVLPGGANPVADPVQGLTGTAAGTLLYTDGNTLGGVHVLNPATGGLISTHALPGIANRGGLSWDTGLNSLFSVNNGNPVVQQTGLGGAVNPAFIPSLSPAFPGAIGGDDNGRHFSQGFEALAGPGIFEFNPVTGAIMSHLPFPGVAPDVSGLAFDGTFLYATELSSNFLYTLDPNTGAILFQTTYLGGPITALASLPSRGVPLPATLLLLALGLVAIGRLQRRA